MSQSNTTDRCAVCGRFVGRYPNRFYCDTHCARCVCTRCPGFRDSPRRWAEVDAANRAARDIERSARAAA